MTKADTNGHGGELGERVPERVALYLRVSSEEQRDAGTIQTQREFLESYARLHGFEVAETYADDGVSGTVALDQRPEGRRLLSDAKEGKFGSVLVYKLDRLGRKLLVAVEAHDQLEESGVALVSANEHIDTSTPSGRMHFQMLGTFAEFERENIRQRTRDGLHRAFRNGKLIGTLPYGYMVGEDGKLTLVPEEAAIVREIFENIAGGGTVYAEAQRLNDAGVEPPGWRYRRQGRTEKRVSALWSENTINAMLHRPVYSGTNQISINGGRDTIEQDVPALVERDLQDKALAQLVENRRYSGGLPGRRDYLLSGLVTCAVCGASCTGRTKSAWKGKYRYAYYKCSDDHPTRRHRAEKGHAPGIRADWLEEEVWGHVRGFLANPGEVLEQIRAQEESGEKDGELAERHKRLTRELAALQKGRERLHRLYVMGEIDDDELDARLADLRGDIAHKKTALEAVEARIAAQDAERDTIRTTEAYLTLLADRLEYVDANPDLKRELIRLLVSEIIVGRDEDGKPLAHITYLFGPPRDEQDSLVTGNSDSRLSWSIPTSSTILLGRWNSGWSSCP